MQNLNLKMQNDSVKFKNEFKKRLYDWVLRLVKFIDKLSKDSVRSVTGKQLLRRGTSVLVNYIEVNSVSSKKDFINFFNHSLKSANESKVWLALLKDLSKGNMEELKRLLNELCEIANVVAAGILTLKGR